MAANDVYAIIAKGNQLFTGTSQGLTILTPQKIKENEKPMWQARSIGRTQGLNQIDFSENSFTIDRKGRFWAGVNGLQLTVLMKLNLTPSLNQLIFQELIFLIKNMIFKIIQN